MNEETLELAVKELFEAQEYTCVKGNTILCE